MRAPITFVSNNALRAAEKFSHKVLAASYCPEDGYANSSLTGQYRIRLKENEVICEKCNVKLITRNSYGFNLTTSAARPSNVYF